MAPVPVFDRLTRYPVRPWMDPRENRLSATFATVAEQVPDVARELAGVWVGEPIIGDLTVETQKPVASGFIDVALAFTSQGRTTALVWIEAKHGSKLSGVDQLTKYLADLRRQPGRLRALVLLVPADFDYSGLDVLRPQDAVAGDGVPRLVSWQEVYAELYDARTRDQGPLERWLVDEFLAFLENEGLSERALDQTTVTALENMVDAEDAVYTVMRRADDIVARAWGDRQQRPKPAYAFDGYASTYKPWPKRPGASRRNWRGAKLVWGLGSPFAEPGKPRFFAGLKCGAGGPLTRPANETWIAALRQRGFELGPEGSDWYLTSYLLPSRLLKAKRAQTQAEMLARWVLDEFEKANTPAPPG